MNFGFDGKRAANNLTGLGNYSRSLIAQLAKIYPQNQYFVYSPKLSIKKQIADFFTQHAHLRLQLPDASSMKFMWRSFGVKTQIKADRIDLFHGLSQELPIGIQAMGIKTVVTIHDLIYLRHPEYYKAVDRFIYNKKSEYACKNSDAIIAISERTRQDIIAYYKVPAEKIKVIYQSCDDSFKQSCDLSFKALLLEKYKLPTKYILNVGTIEPRKNLLLLIRALKDIDPGYSLVVVGKPKTYAQRVYKEIDRLGLQDRVIFLEGLPFEDLPGIYQMASLFVYPSFYEGFGIPIIEALYSHVPIIAATGSCLEEAGGPDSIYIAPDDVAGLAIQANRVLSDPELRERMIEKGAQFVQKFENDLLAKQMMDCYISTLNH